MIHNQSAWMLAALPAGLGGSAPVGERRCPSAWMGGGRAEGVRVTAPPETVTHSLVGG